MPEALAGRRPPLACPAISPARGRSAITTAFADLGRRKKSEAPKLPISPLVRALHGGASSVC
ncbi:MAG: hypothetical protein EOR75_29835, partial [Mesorhizobium sp.]